MARDERPRIGAIAASSRVDHALGLCEAPAAHRRPQRLQMGLPRQLGIERFQALGRSAQQHGRVTAAGARERDVGLQPIDSRAIQLVERADGRNRQKAFGCRRRAGVKLGLRGGDCALTAPLDARGQFDSSLQERCRRLRTRACLRTRRAQRSARRPRLRQERG